MKVLNRVGNDSVCNMLLCEDDDDDDAFAITCDNCMLFDALLFLIGFYVAVMQHFSVGVRSVSK